MRHSLTLLAGLLAIATQAPAHAAEPVRIGITTILSGPFADRGQSEQYGAQLALDRINQAGGVLGRPVEAFYADNACKPEVGVPATKRLIEAEHVAVVIGALCTPVTHAIMPLMAAAKVPLVIATSAGQDFVDASGPSGNDYTFKTIPSEVDIARGLVRYLASKSVKSVAILADPGGFPHSNAVALAQAAQDAGIKVLANDALSPTSDLPALLTTLKAAAPEELVVVLGPSTNPFFHAYAAADWPVPVTGRYDLGAAAAALPAGSPLQAGLTGVTVFTPALDTPGVKDFVAAYRAHYGITPTQRSFFVYEAVDLVVDAMRRAGSDQPAAIEQALKTTNMASMLGGTYAPDAHNHAHTPLQILGLSQGVPTVIATEPDQAK